MCRMWGAATQLLERAWGLWVLAGGVKSTCACGGVKSRKSVKS